ncbi:telomere length regulation protein-domain-containing protein [Mortierella sp. GBAus27b]|nr:telomere binding protein [Mortierella sp. GBA43]KAI8345547.1 telomere length regulation protein-domain-containing protein [Mortierella sp. GBAus27b]
MSRSAADTHAISAYLTDLQNNVRGSSAELSTAIRVLAEPLSFLGLLDPTTTAAIAAANGSLPSWAGPIPDPTLADRRHFIQHVLPSHLDFVLDTMTIDWLSVLTTAQQTALFDTYFVPALATRSSRHPRSHPYESSSEAMMVTVSLQTLVGRVNARFNENHSFLNKTILRLLRKVLDTYSLMDFYRGCSAFSSSMDVAAAATSVGSGSGSGSDSMFWDSFLSKLFSIPTRVSNALGLKIGTTYKTDIEECFQESPFFQRQAAYLQNCVKSLIVHQKPGAATCTAIADDGDDDDGRISIHHAKAFAMVVAKFLRIGHGKILVESVISTLWPLDSGSGDASRGWKLVLTHTTSPGTLQLFLTTLIKHLHNHQLDFDHGGSNSSSSSGRLLSQSNPKSDSQQPEYQLAVVHRAAHLLISIGFGAVPDVDDTQAKGKEGDGNKSRKRKESSVNGNNRMIEDMLFQGREYGLGVLRTLICIQTGWPTSVKTDKDSVLARTLKRALQVWSDSMFVNHASAEYQRYVSYQLLLMIGYLDAKAFYDLDLLGVFGQGMGNWLEMDNTKRKLIALIVAEEFSRVGDTIGSPANFDLDSTDPQVQLARSLVQLKDGAKTYDRNALRAFGNNSGRPESTADTGTNSSAEAAHVDSLPVQQDDSDDEEDPDEIVDPLVSVSIPRDDDSEDDEEDDLKPYAMEDESDPDEDDEAVKRPKIAAPVYVRDLLSYIRANEDRGKIEVGLKSAAELIRRKAGSLELEETAGDLALLLSVLQDNFDLTDFYKLREDALISLVVASPVVVAGVLTIQFYERSISMGHRLNILRALALGAKELSGFDRAPSVPQQPSSSAASKGKPSPPVKESSGPLVAQQRPTMDSITNSIAEAKTRRFSQKSRIDAQRPAPKANAFSKLAPVFLGGLLGRWGGNRGAGMERGFDALQKAPVIVLKQFVLTLGVMVYYAGNSPHLIPITRELFLFLFALRYHNPPTQKPGGPGPSRAPTVAISTSSLSEPSLTSLRLPGDIGITSSLSSASSGKKDSLSILSSSSLPYNPELLESILFDLLILLTPSSQTLSDDVMVQEFYAEIGECQLWAMELWEHYKLQDIGTGDKSRMYCAALLQRCFELLEVHM